MATAWSEVIAAAMIQIDDVRLHEELSVSPAQFYRRMAGIVTQALPLLSRPPEFAAYLKRDMSEPAYGDFSWTSTEESTAQETEIDTGLTGYELCSVVLRQAQPNGAVQYYPAEAAYDAETGVVTFPAQSAAGLSYDLDFYTDGAFQDLTETQLRLFALAIAVVWDERFSRSWLNLQPKIHDESFTTVNEANYMAQVVKRLGTNRVAFNDELKWYEQRCAYTAALQNRAGKVTLV